MDEQELTEEQDRSSCLELCFAIDVLQLGFAVVCYKCVLHAVLFMQWLERDLAAVDMACILAWPLSASYWNVTRCYKFFQGLIR